MHAILLLSFAEQRMGSSTACSAASIHSCTRCHCGLTLVTLAAVTCCHSLLTAVTSRSPYAGENGHSHRERSPRYSRERSPRRDRDERSDRERRRDSRERSPRRDSRDRDDDRSERRRERKKRSGWDQGTQKSNGCYARRCCLAKRYDSTPHACYLCAAIATI